MNETRAEVRGCDVSAMLAFAALLSLLGVHPTSAAPATKSSPARIDSMVVPAVVAPPDSAARARLQKMCDYGLTLAYSGEAARAESVFIALLSRSPGDPRALNNLGNLSFMRGELDVARAFYDAAHQADTADAGIHLNRAAAALALGDQERAEREAEIGVRMAGGPEAAAALMGLRSVAGEPKASELSARVQLSWSARKPQQRTSLSADEIRSLLGAGAAKPATARAESTSTKNPPSGAPVAARTGTKASDAGGGVTLLYWKR